MRQVSIGQVKRDISLLVNRVAFAGERIVLTSRGKPKAALVSFEDCQRLEAEEEERKEQRLQAWLVAARELGDSIRQEQGGDLPVDEILERDRSDLESRG